RWDCASGLLARKVKVALCWGHCGLFPKEHSKPKVARYQNVARTTVWATVWPQTEKSRDFCCITRLSNGLGWQQDQATALSVLFREESTCDRASPGREEGNVT